MFVYCLSLLSLLFILHGLTVSLFHLPSIILNFVQLLITFTIRDYHVHPWFTAMKRWLIVHDWHSVSWVSFLWEIRGHSHSFHCPLRLGIVDQQTFGALKEQEAAWWEWWVGDQGRCYYGTKDIIFSSEGLVTSPFPLLQWYLLEFQSLFLCDLFVTFLLSLCFLLCILLFLSLVLW